MQARAMAVSASGRRRTLISPNEQAGSGEGGASLVARRNAYQESITRSALFSVVGTSDYLAPEVILASGHDTAVDWWALGVVMFEMLIGVPPFYDGNLQATFENILSRNIEWPEELSPEARDIIDRLLTVDVNERLGSRGAAEVKQHPFFRGIDWANLHNQQPFFLPTVKGDDDTGNFQPGSDPTHVDDGALGDREDFLDPEGFEEFSFVNHRLLGEANLRVAASIAGAPKSKTDSPVADQASATPSLVTPSAAATPVTVAPASAAESKKPKKLTKLKARLNAGDKAASVSEDELGQVHAGLTVLVAEVSAHVRTSSSSPPSSFSPPTSSSPSSSCSSSSSSLSSLNAPCRSAPDTNNARTG
jgi:serine/threonine protein kinase